MVATCAKGTRKSGRGAPAFGASLAIAAIAAFALWTAPATAHDVGQAPELQEVPIAGPSGGFHLDLQRTKAAVIVATADAEGNVKIECRDSVPEDGEGGQ